MARNRLAYALLIGLLLLPLASSLEQVVHPWREADVLNAAAFVRAQQRPEDLILGNDVAQQYYFRHEGSAFHLLDESPIPPPPGTRLWVVMTAALPRNERLLLASHLVPSGWRKLEEREFAYTSVLLFAR